jgi:molecular chaperone DnaK (HSP70)
MRLGIDFGTTRIVAAAADRGNFPVAAFECPDGVAREWTPPLIAVSGSKREYGWDAWSRQGDPGVTVIRSLKRVLADAGPGSEIQLGNQRVPLLRVLEEMLASFRTQLVDHSGLRIGKDEKLEVLLGVPANANSNQRFLTVEGFRAAGFEVLGLLNEPSAASIEYMHRLGDLASKSGERILVYDLGGGTFDVSLVRHEAGDHEVMATESIPTLGGDDFDEILAELAMEAVGELVSRNELSGAEEFTLLEECREKKESLHPNTRRLIVDLDRVREGLGQIAVPVADFYERATPLVEETLAAVDDLLAKVGEGEQVSLYITGGASDLPLVPRQLRERFGRRVKRSAYTRSATAIGLAIQAGEQAGYRLRERFTRYFGVWREAESGRRMTFDPLFEKGALLPASSGSSLEVVRRYAPVHNIGHFRYLECTHRGHDGEPTGDITAWDEIRFPFDPALAEADNLEARTVVHSERAREHHIEERYTADASGSVRVRISNLTAGYGRVYRLGKWAAQPVAVLPQQTPRKRRAANG